MKSTLKNPKYTLKINGKAVHKMNVEFYVTEDNITKAIKEKLPSGKTRFAVSIF